MRVELDLRKLSNLLRPQPMPQPRGRSYRSSSVETDAIFSRGGRAAEHESLEGDLVLTVQRVELSESVLNLAKLPYN